MRLPVLSQFSISVVSRTKMVEWVSDTRPIKEQYRREQGYETEACIKGGSWMEEFAYLEKNIREKRYISADEGDGCDDGFRCVLDCLGPA